MEDIEYGLLENVFEIFVNLPDDMAAKIPDIRGPEALSYLKKFRSVIQKRVKMAKDQLKCKQNNPETKKSSLMSSDFSLVADKKIKDEKKLSDNILKDHSLRAGNLRSSTSFCENQQSFPKFEQEITKLNQNTHLHSSYNGYHYNESLNRSGVNELQNEVDKVNQNNSQHSSSHSLSLMTYSKFKNSTCTITSLNMNSKENLDIDCDKLDLISNLNAQKPTSSTQVLSKGKRRNTI